MLLPAQNVLLPDMVALGIVLTTIGVPEVVPVAVVVVRQVPVRLVAVTVTTSPGPKYASDVLLLGSVVKVNELDDDACVTPFIFQVYVVPPLK